MSFKEFFKSNHFNKSLAFLAVAVILIFIFILGIFVGHEKTRFSYRWGENYYGNIMGRRGMMDFEKRGFNAHSGLGQIIKLEENSLVIKSRSNIEKTILVNEQTQIVQNNQNINLSDLKIDDQIIVLGRPNEQGQIEARLIRVMPGNPLQPLEQ